MQGELNSAPFIGSPARRSWSPVGYNDRPDQAYLIVRDWERKF